MSAEQAAGLFALVCAGVCAFQVALILGAPWGEFTLGGRWRGRLPARVRLIPAFSLLLLLGFIAIMLARAGLLLGLAPELGPGWAWGVVGYCALGCVANAATPSPRERKIWLPVLLGMTALSLRVATA